MSFNRIKKKKSLKEKEPSHTLTFELLNITGVNMESLKDFNSKLVLFIKCLSLKQFTRHSNGNGIFLAIESIFINLNKIKILKQE